MKSCNTYTCYICYYRTTRKSNYQSHLNRKRPCSFNTIKLEESKSPFEESKSPTQESKSPSEELGYIRQNNKWKCCKCSATMSSQGKQYHTNYACKRKLFGILKCV